MPEFELHDVIKLTTALSGVDDDDRKYDLPIGAKGTILIFGDNRYMVEFCEGIKTLAIITVTEDQIEPVDN